MNFLVKIEELINGILNRITDAIFGFIARLVPNKMKLLLARWRSFLPWLKNEFPQMAKAWLLNTITKVKANAKTYNYKEKFLEAYQATLTKYQAKKSQGSGKLKVIVMTPVMMVADWMKGLTPTQTMMLLGFSGASFLSIIGVIFSGQRILKHQDVGRFPASSVEAPYERPKYYKMETKHLQITNLKLPVYVGGVNDVRSVDIDFVATMSNRQIRKDIDKLEFQLRDYIIHETEPMVATFPLEDEGKEIIRAKLTETINGFIAERKLEGNVEQVEIIYILAN